MAISIGIGSALIGGATSLYGMKAQKKDQRAQAAAQQAQVAEQQRALGFQNQIIDLQMQENDQRKQALILDTTRRKREMVRNAIAARSQALTVATAQGAAQGSALAGSYGGISGRTNVNELGVNQNAEIGLNIFDLNDKISAKNKDLAAAQTSANQYAGVANTYAQAGQQNGQLVNLGMSIFGNAASIGKIGSSIGGWFPSGGLDVFKGFPGGSLTGGN